MYFYVNFVVLLYYLLNSQNGVFPSFPSSLRRVMNGIVCLGRRKIFFIDFFCLWETKNLQPVDLFYGNSVFILHVAFSFTVRFLLSHLQRLWTITRIHKHQHNHQHPTKKRFIATYNKTNSSKLITKLWTIIFRSHKKHLIKSLYETTDWLFFMLWNNNDLRKCIGSFSAVMNSNSSSTTNN